MSVQRLVRTLYTYVQGRIRKQFTACIGRAQRASCLLVRKDISYLLGEESVRLLTCWRNFVAETMSFAVSDHVVPTRTGLQRRFGFGLDGVSYEMASVLSAPTTGNERSGDRSRPRPALCIRKKLPRSLVNTSSGTDRAPARQRLTLRNVVCPPGCITSYRSCRSDSFRRHLRESSLSSKTAATGRWATTILCGSKRPGGFIRTGPSLPITSVSTSC